MCTHKTGGAIKLCLLVIEFGAKSSLARLFDVATVGIEHRNRQTYGKENGTVPCRLKFSNAEAEAGIGKGIGLLKFDLRSGLGESVTLTLTVD